MQTRPKAYWVAGDKNITGRQLSFRKYRIFFHSFVEGRNLDGHWGFGMAYYTVESSSVRLFIKFALDKALALLNLEFGNLTVQLNTVTDFMFQPI